MSSVLVSVLIPLEEDRNSAERSIRTWCSGQTVDARRYEVIAVASSTAGEHRLANIRGLLRAHDRLVMTTSAHDIGQVAHAAALAHGELLFFSESHVWPSPDVLERSLRVMELHPEWAAITCGSKRVVRNRLGAAEADMYERDFEIGRNQLGWRNILDQCFLTRRAPYLAAGGFDASLGHFAEWVLAARYKTAGFVVTHCPEIELWHVFTGEVRELKGFTEDFVRGEMTYLARDPATRREALVEAPVEWSCRGDRRRDLAAHIVRMVASETLRARTERRAANVSWRLALERVPVMLAGGRPARTAAALRLLACRTVLTVVRFGRERSVAAAFERCMAAIIRHARLRFADAQLAHRRPPDSGEVWNAFPDRGDAGAGLHDCELLDGVPFRWSEPAAAIALNVPPGRYLVRVNTLWKQLANTALTPEFSLDGRRVAGVRTSNGGNTIAFVVDVHSEHASLGWICPPTSAPGDTRQLGLPLVSVEATATATASSADEARDAVRAAMRDLRAALDAGAERPRAGAARAHAEEMSRALADRDRSAAELRRQADERLAVIERVTRDAEDRLTALQQTTAEAEALREEIARLNRQRDDVSAENDGLWRTAQERLAVIERVTGDAEDRLTALQRATAEAEALREAVARLNERLALVSAENEILQRAAQERLDLLHVNRRAYAELEAQIRTNG